jgi:CheY-like chemotaxis protein
LVARKPLFASGIVAATTSRLSITLGQRRAKPTGDGDAGWSCSVSDLAGTVTAGSVPSTILICDDEEPMRALVRAALELGDYEIYEARTGDESMELARERKPDLVVLDMMMPGRSGLDVLRELRQDPDLREIRVLMLTARAQATDRSAAVAYGANRYLSKPFSPLELAGVVEELLARPR